LAIVAAIDADVPAPGPARRVLRLSHGRLSADLGEPAEAAPTRAAETA
jgi:hypothetical protein